MKKEQNAWDVRLVIAGGIAPILLVVFIGLSLGLWMSILLYWGLVMRVFFTGAEKGPVDPEMVLYCGDIY